MLRRTTVCATDEHPKVGPWLSRPFPDVEGILWTSRQVDGAQAALLFGKFGESKAEGHEEISRISSWLVRADV
jgi:hypothetical protein